MTADGNSQALTVKQTRFVEEYCIDFNGAQSAIRAGYSENSAKEIASENLTKPNIAEAIAKRLESLEKKGSVKREWVISKLVENTQRSMTATPVFDKDGCETGEYTYQGNVANKSLELIGKHLGMFEEKHKHLHEGSATVYVIPSNDRGATAEDGDPSPSGTADRLPDDTR